MPSDGSKNKKILVNSLTNIGDVILTMPVIDILMRDYPDADISLIIGPKARSLFDNTTRYESVYIYDKKQPPLKTIKWVWHLRRQRFDLMVDLRNSAIPFLIAPKQRTPAARIKTDDIHMRLKHLNRLKRVHAFENETAPKKALEISEKDEYYIDQLLNRKFDNPRSFVLIAPGAAFHKKRWPAGKFARLADEIKKERDIEIVFAGDDHDQRVAERIAGLMQQSSINLAGMTSLIQLAALILRSDYVISNDSSPMHLASYFDKPVLALFGPSNPVKYGPWSRISEYCQADEDGDEIDITTIAVEDVLSKAKSIHERL